MRRMLLVMSVAALMVAMMVASAMPAFAAANENANVRGEGASNFAPQNREEFGEFQSFQAQNPELFGSSNFGERVKAEAQTR